MSYASAARYGFPFELHRWEQPNAPLVADTPGPDAIAAAVRAGYAQAREDDADTICLSAVRYEFRNVYRSRTTTMKPATKANGWPTSKVGW